MRSREIVAWLAVAYMLLMLWAISASHPKERDEGYAMGFKNGYSNASPAAAKTCDEARFMVLSRACTKDDGER